MFTNKEPNSHHENDSSDGQGLSRVVKPSDGILETPKDEEWDSKETRS